MRPRDVGRGRDERRGGLSGGGHMAARRSGTLNGDGARVAPRRVRAHASCDCMRDTGLCPSATAPLVQCWCKRTVPLGALPPRAISSNHGPLLLLNEELAYIPEP